MRPEHRAPRPAWGENPQRPARYDAAGRKPRAVRASGGRSRSPGRKIPIYTPRAAVLVMTLGHYRWSLLGISARHPRTRGNPIPGRWINGGSRRARGPRGTVRRPARRVWSGRSRTRLPRVLPGFERARAASVSRLRVQSGAARPEPEPSDLLSRQFSRRGILFQSNQHHHRGLRAGPVERPARGLLRERQRGDSGRSDRVQPRPGPHLRSVAGRHVHRHAPYGVEVLQADGAGTVLITTGP